MRRRRLAPVAVELRELALAPADDGLRTVEPPPVAVAGVAVAPELETAALALDDEPVDVLGVELAPPVDVIPVRLAGSLFAERTREVRFDPPRLEAMPLVAAPIESPPARPGPGRGRRPAPRPPGAHVPPRDAASSACRRSTCASA